MRVSVFSTLNGIILALRPPVSAVPLTPTSVFHVLQNKNISSPKTTTPHQRLNSAKSSLFTPHGKLSTRPDLRPVFIALLTVVSRSFPARKLSFSRRSAPNNSEGQRATRTEPVPPSQMGVFRRIDDATVGSDPVPSVCPRPPFEREVSLCPVLERMSFAADPFC